MFTFTMEFVESPMRQMLKSALSVMWDAKVCNSMLCHAEQKNEESQKFHIKIRLSFFLKKSDRKHLRQSNYFTEHHNQPTHSYKV